MEHSKRSIKLTLLTIVAMSLLIGCKSDGEEIEQPEKIYYDQAQARMAS